MTHEGHGLPGNLGPYRILAALGTRPRWVVYKAFDARTGITVVLKVFRVEEPTAGSGPSSFEREALALARLDHPGIARLVETGTFETAFGPRPYLATEYIDGLNLRDYLHTTKPSPKRRLALFLELCETIAFAHRMNVVHRDLKPENIIVRSDGRPVIVDFGVARILDARSEIDRSRVGQMLGTLRYMSPEQARVDGAAITARTDLYALGIIGFEMLCGQLPYVVSDNPPTTILTIVTQPPRWLGDVDSLYRGAIEAIINRAIQKRPADRYPSAEAMASDLRRAISGQPIARATPGRTRDRARDRIRRLQRVRRPVLLFGVGLVALALLLAWARERSQSPAAEHSDYLGYLDHLQAADDLRHAVDPWQNGWSGAAAADSCRRPIAMFLEAQKQWAKLPPRPTAPAEAQYIDWRLAELRYFVGETLHDPDSTAAACRAFERSSRHPWPLFDRTTMDANHTILNRIRGFAPQIPASGCALCERTLARYRAPGLHLRRALDHQRAAMAALDDAIARNPNDEWTPADRDGNAQGLAQILVRAGTACDRLEWIDAGRRELQAMLTRALTPAGREDVCYDIGCAWRARAELVRSATDADSAQQWLDLAAVTDTASTERWKIQMEQAFASLAGATFDPSPQRLSECEVRVDAVFADSAASRNPRGDLFLDALTDLSLADVQLRFVELQAASSPTAPIAPLLDRADRCLDRAASRLADRRYVVPRAELTLLRSRSERLRRGSALMAASASHAGAAEAGAPPALGSLEEALAGLPIADSPRLHRLIRTEMEGLRSVSTPRSP